MSVAASTLPTMTDPGDPRDAGEVEEPSSDAWAQIASHLARTPERAVRAEQIADERQVQVEQLIASGVPTRPLRRVRTLSPPFGGATLVEVGTQYDGALGLWWSDPNGERDVFTVEAEASRVAAVNVSPFPGPVDYIATLPGQRWLGSAARADWLGDDTVVDTAWVIDAGGSIQARGCLGDAHLRPVVTPDARIFVTYFDEHPDRGCDGAWVRDNDGGWVAVPNSARPLAFIDEYSAEGRYSAGYSGMTVFNDQLRVIGRHVSPTPVCEVYAFHTDGERFWYVSYPDWVIDSWGPHGQGKPQASGEFKGMPLIAHGGRIARFGGDGQDRDSLYTQDDDHQMRREVVTYPDGTALRRGIVTTWGHQMHYVDGLNWYVLDVFHGV